MIPRLQTVALHKEYPGTIALGGVSLSLAGGQVHALVGKNGAGKSTLVKILSGCVQPTSGQILVDGREVRLRSPLDAYRAGIATVYQELSLVPSLSVAENILLGRLPQISKLGLRRIDWHGAHREAQRLLDEMAARIDACRKVHELSVAEQQVVEIAKAFSCRPSALLLDEPTSALSRHETANLLGLVRRLASQGVAVVYITHRLQELAEVADVVYVLRDGKLVGDAKVGQASRLPRGPSAQESEEEADSLVKDPAVEPATGQARSSCVSGAAETPALLSTVVQMMFGPIEHRHRPADLVPGPEPVLQVRRLERRGKLRDISFTLRRGEILGIAGMLGSGRTELLRAIFGAEKPDEGEVLIQGRLVKPRDPAAMRALGLALTPENRKEEGLVLRLGTRPNFFLASLSRMARCGVSSATRERKRAQELIQQLGIQVPNLEWPVSSLSGGNQQKVVIGKWLNSGPRVVLLDEPTRGVDLAAKQQIFQIIWDLARRGIGCIFVSSELEELLEVCHRILILKDGKLAGEVDPESVTPADLAVRCMSV